MHDLILLWGRESSELWLLLAFPILRELIMYYFDLFLPPSLPSSQLPIYLQASGCVGNITYLYMNYLLFEALHIVVGIKYLWLK